MSSSHRVLEFTPAQHRPSENGAERMLRSDIAFELSGPSPAMQRLWSQIRHVGPYFRTALLLGEPGTGAGAVAEALHQASPFRDQKLRILPASAAEIYFAYGGAHGRNPTNGILYLPEVEQLSSIAQRGVLRLVRLRGGRAGCVIAKARQDLRALVSGGSFCAELAASLNALRIVLPPLRERPEDVPTLLRAFFTETQEPTPPQLSADFLRAASEYSWRRNLDQMREMVSWLQENHSGPELTAADFAAARVLQEPDPVTHEPPVRMVRLDVIVYEHLRAVLLACQGNKLRAAEILGISRSTLYRMLDATAPSALLGRTG